MTQARDLNQFLSFDAITDGSFEEFELVIEPTSSQLIDSTNAQFTVTSTVTVRYPNRTAACVQYTTDGLICLNYELNASRSLSVSDQLLSDLWLVDADSNAMSTSVTLRLPQFVLSQFNQDMLDAGVARNELLDIWKADDIQIDLSINLASTVAAALTINGPTNGVAPAKPMAFKDSALTTTVSAIRNMGTGIVESKQTAQAYYDAIDPNREAETLDDWLVKAGFATQNSDPSITMLPEALSGTDTATADFAHAAYTNNFDLGFGRDMFVKIGNDGSVYSYVENYATLEAALKKFNPIATVVMEYSPPEGNPNGAKFVKFYTYIPDENGHQIRVTDFDFDGRGQKYMPGVCAACHSGRPLDIDIVLGRGQNPVNYSGDIGAAFLPWDLDSFLYSDDDPAIVNIAEVEPDPSNLRFNRASQEEQFRKLNQAAYHTFKDSTDPVSGANPDPRFDSAIDLVGGSNGNAGWYSDASCTTGVNKSGCIDFNSSSQFNGDYVPTAWAQDSDVYSNVIAPHCRACHIARAGTGVDPALNQLIAPSQLLDNRDEAIDLVYSKGVMPMARLTMDRFWTGTDSNLEPSEQLWRFLNPNDPTILLPKPGAPIPVVASSPIPFYSILESQNGQDFLTTKTGRTIVFDASASVFTNQFQWELLDSTSIAGFENCMTDPNALVSNGDKAELTPSIANITSQFYCVRLTAINDVAITPSAILFVRVFDNRQPQVLFTSNCAIDNECISILELNSDPATSTVALGAVTISDVIDFTTSPNINTLFQIVDEDVSTGLDAPSVLSFELTSTLLYGNLSLSNFGLDQLSSNEQVVYTTALDNFGISPLTEVLNFDVFDDNVPVSNYSTEIRIDPLNEGRPIFENVNAPNTTFGTSTNSNFDVRDSDLDAITLTTTLPANSLGTLSTNFVQQTADLSSFTYTYTAKTAQQIAMTSGNLCGGGTQSINSGISEVFQLLADDVLNDPDPAVSRNVTATIRPSLSSNVAPAFGQKIATVFDPDGDINRTCDTCHGSGQFPTATDWIGNYGELVSLINLPTPDTSPMFTAGLPNSGHSGGTYPVDFTNNARDRDMLEWIYQCAPQ